VPSGRCAAFQTTVVVLPEALAVGVLPVGIVAATASAFPLVKADHAASAVAENAPSTRTVVAASRRRRRGRLIA
jgi:hypothetical protein